MRPMKLNLKQSNKIVAKKLTVVAKNIYELL